MTPILLSGETVKGFLPDATSCVVTEERNGIFELELTYPVAGPMFGELAVDRYIKAKPNDTADLQLFRIYEITKPIAGIVTVKGEHVSYALAHYPITNVSGTGTAHQAVSAVLSKVNAYLTLSRQFSSADTGWSAQKTYKYLVGSARAALGGSEGSLLDTFGGEYEWDNYTVKLHEHRGHDTGVVVAYRKNMTDMKVTTSLESAYTALFPYAIKDDVLITLQGGKIAVPNASGIADRVLIRDFSGEFQDDETVSAATLLTKAQAYLNANSINAPSVSVTVSFIHLWQSPEYAELAALEKVSLCDWVTVRHEVLGVNVKAQVIKTEYDCIAERYNQIELGSARANFQDTLRETVADIKNLIKNMDIDVDTSAITEAYTQAIADATALITGADGGYVHLLPSGSAPQEIVISDIENYTSSTAKVWRWNKNGLGYSSTGYSGNYETAITKDGKINASMITTGTLNASVIHAGNITYHTGVEINLEGTYIKTTRTAANGQVIGTKVNEGAYRLLAGNNEIGGLGRIGNNEPWLFVNTTYGCNLQIGHGSTSVAYPHIVVKNNGETDFVGYTETNGTLVGSTVGTIKSDGYHGTVYGAIHGDIHELSGASSLRLCYGGYIINWVDSDGLHGRLCDFETWKSGTYASDWSSIWSAINGKASSNHDHGDQYLSASWYSQNTPGGYTYDYNQIWSAINGKASSNHNHDSKYLSKSWYSQNTAGGYTYDYNRIWDAIDGKVSASALSSYIPWSWYNQNTAGGYTYDYNRIWDAIDVNTGARQWFEKRIATSGSDLLIGMMKNGYFDPFIKCYYNGGYKYIEFICDMAAVRDSRGLRDVLS